MTNEQELARSILEDLRRLREEILAVHTRAEEASAGSPAVLARLHSGFGALTAAIQHSQQELETDFHAVEAELSALGQHYAELHASLEAEHHSATGHLDHFHHSVEKRKVTHQNHGHHAHHSVQGATTAAHQEHSRLEQAQHAVGDAHHHLQQEVDGHRQHTHRHLEELHSHAQEHAQQLHTHSEQGRHQWGRHAQELEAGLGDVGRALSHGTDGLRQYAMDAVEQQVHAVIREGLDVVENAVEEGLHRLGHDANDLGAVRGLLQPLVEEMGHLLHPLKEHSDAVHHRAHELGIQ